MNHFRFCGVQYDASGVAIEQASPEPDAPGALEPTPGQDTPDYPEFQPAAGDFVFDDGPEGEGAAVGTLSIPPSFVLPVTLGYAPANRLRTELGYYEVRARGSTPRRGYDVQWAALNAADFATLSAFFDAHQETAFNWTPPDGSSGKYALRSDGARAAFRSAKIGPAVYRGSATLEELR